MIRTEGKTPNGGSYSIMYFYDKDGNEVEPENAVVAYGCEFDENDNLIFETVLNKDDNNKNNDKFNNSVSKTVKK